MDLFSKFLTLSGLSKHKESLWIGSDFAFDKRYGSLGINQCVKMYMSGGIAAKEKDKLF